MRGVTGHALYRLLGQFDAITIIEGDDAVQDLLLAIGAQGALRTEAYKAMTLDDVQRLTAGIGG